MIRVWFGWLYDVALLRLELAFTALLLANVVVLSLVLILARNLQLPIWDPSALSRIIFASAFLACLYGGCLATRAHRQIAIDALSSYLPGPIRRRVEGFTSAVAALASLALYIQALSRPDGRSPGLAGPGVRRTSPARVGVEAPHRGGLRADRASLRRSLGARLPGIGRLDRA